MTLGLAVNLAALAVVITWLLRRSYPLTEAVRVRNALLLAPSRPGDFTWTPDAVPEDFRLERRPPSPELAGIVRGLRIDRLTDDWSKARVLATHLIEHVAEDETGPVQSDLLTTYRRNREGYGYCADFVKVYLALAHAAGLVARQWAFSFDGFGGHGHTFVEVFDRQRGKWLFIDVFNNFHAVAAPAGEPLGALEMRDLLRERPPDVRFEANGPGRPGFIHPEKALDYYRRGLREWYLWWGNAVLSADANPVARWAARLGGGLGRLVSMVFNGQPRIRILRTDENRAQAEALARLRTRIWLAIALLLGLLVWLAVQLVRAGAQP
jgi:hypothetical protein